MSSGYFGIDPETEKRLARAIKFADFSNHNEFIFSAMLEKIERCEQNMNPEALATPKNLEASAKPAPVEAKPAPVAAKAKPTPAAKASPFSDMLARADNPDADEEPGESLDPDPVPMLPRAALPSCLEREAAQRAALAAISPSVRYEEEIARAGGYSPPASVYVAKRKFRRVSYVPTYCDPA